MSLLTIIQAVVSELGIAKPSTVIGNQNQTIEHLLALTNREGDHLSKRAWLQELRFEASHVSLAQEDQGDITVIAPGFDRLIEGTFWDRTDQRELIGPVSADEWQFLKANTVTPSTTHYRLRGQRLLALPAPTAGNQWNFEYSSDLWISLAAGGTAKIFASDNDVSLIDEVIIEMGVIWRWLKSKGLDYAEEKRDYEVALKNYQLANDARTLTLGVGRRRLARGDFKAVGV